MNRPRVLRPTRPTKRPRIERTGAAAPIPPRQHVFSTLRFTDYRLTRAFYTVLLGFRVDWEKAYDPDMAVLMRVSRNGMALLLTQHADDCEPGGLVHLVVPDVDAWYAELRRRGTPVRSAPHTGLDGQRTMTLLDPDGNRLRISTRPAQ